MGGGKFQFFIKFVVLLFVCTAFASCSEEDRFGIGLERPEDAVLTEFQKKTLRTLCAESIEEMKNRLKNAIFYRVTANYTHKDRKTGEIEEISFDVVAMCGGNIFMDVEGYTVAESGGGVTPPAHFYESTGWVSSDDGFLALDKPRGGEAYNADGEYQKGNGRIDDIAELFGAPGVSGFDELAEYDDNESRYKEAA